MTCAVCCLAVAWLWLPPPPPEACVRFNAVVGAAVLF